MDVPANILTNGSPYQFELVFANGLQTASTTELFEFATTGQFQGATGSLFLSFFN